MSGADDVLEQASLTLDLDELGALEPTHLDRLFDRIRRGSGHDFSGYKRTTVGRRVARRMAALELPSLDSYLGHLEVDAQEVDALVRELLISVTSFFRDSAALALLVEALGPPPAGEPERVWVPGCATGEEAYSIAMLILERGDRALQLFATDIDVAALGRARAGHYPLGIADQVPPARLDRFFTADERGYGVSPALREPCLFSLHNLLHDPPFARLGLVSCRNLLIYLEPELQQQLMQLFHFALRPGGLLLLGSAENVGAESPLFEPVDHHHRLYRRREQRVRPPMWWLGRARGLRPGPLRPSRAAAPTVAARALERALLDEHAPPGAVVTPAGEVVYLVGRGRPFLEPPRGSAPFDLFAMVRPPLEHVLRAALAEAVATHAEVTTADVVVDGDGGATAVRVCVRPMVEVDLGANLFLVVFRELAAVGDLAGVVAAGPPTGTAERELATLRGQWHATLRQLEVANDRLRTSSEATVALNEELQSSQEELQSANEELRAVNADLQQKIEALDAAHADLQHLFEATHLATVLVGPDLRIRRFSPAATEMFGIRPVDVGRPLTDLASRVGPLTIADSVAEVMAHGHQVASRVRRDDDARFLLRVSPFRKTGGEVDGVAITFIDVTEAERAREEARARADELEAVVEAMPAVVFVAHDAAADRVTGNREANRWLRFPGGDGSPRRGGDDGPPVRIRHDGVDLTRDQLAISRAARGESLRGFAVEVLVPGGEVRHLFGNAEPLHAADGSLRGAVGAFVDVTALRQAEGALRDSEARYRILAASAVDFISRFDRDLRLVYANPAVTNNLGRPLAELVGHRSAELGVVAGWDDRLREVLDTGAPHRFDWRSAGDRWFDVQLSPEREGDAVVAVIVVARDISAQKQAEQALRVSEARYGAIVASVPVSVAMVRLRDGAFLAVNAEFERLFGYRADEVIGHSALELGLATPASQAELAAAIAAAGPLRHFECERRTRTGQLVTVALSSEVVDIDGERVAITSAIDITTRRAAEADKARLQGELAQAQKMEAIGTLAGGIAHDFNNILGGILGGLSLLGPDLPAEARAELDEITALVTRGADLTRQLLGFARRGKYDVKAVHLARVLSGLTAMFGRTRRDIVITTELAAELPPVLMDHAQLEQVLLNLFVNAGHAMAEGGDLSVRARPATDDPAGFVIVEIGDTGVGMDAATQGRIFEPFFTTRDAGQGTGLGLASVYGIVTHHGGTVTVTSQLGRGTTFTLRLPAAEAVTPEVAALAVIAAGEGTILIVDDEPQMLRVCRRMLERAGYDVLSADSGRAAIDMVDRHGASLALCVLDMTMPGLGGARTFEEIRRLQPGLKVLLASGFGVERQAHDLLARGGVAFLQKPFTASQLTGKVREVLASGPVVEVR